MKSNYYINAVYKTCANIPKKHDTDDLKFAAYILVSKIGSTATRDLVSGKKSKTLLSESEVDACLYGIRKFLGKDSEKFLKQLGKKITD